MYLTLLEMYFSKTKKKALISTQKKLLEKNFDNNNNE